MSRGSTAPRLPRTGEPVTRLLDGHPALRLRRAIPTDRSRSRCRRTITCRSTTWRSPGALYEAVTEFCGFRSNDDEGKTRGLAPLGDPSRFMETARRCVRVDETEGRIEIDRCWFAYGYRGRRRCGPRLLDAVGTSRAADGEFQDHHRNVAAALQRVLAECAPALARTLRANSDAKHLVIAAGVALDSARTRSTAR